MQIPGRIVKTELKEKVDKDDLGNEFEHAMVIVTVENVTTKGGVEFVAKTQHLVEVEDAGEWPLGGIATVETLLKQTEMKLRATVSVTDPTTGKTVEGDLGKVIEVLSR